MLRVFAALLAPGALCVLAQQAEAPQAQSARPRAQFFAGTVTAVTGKQITVSKTLVGRPSQTRTFLLDSSTKASKSALKVKARVTVRYEHRRDGDVALEIALQPATHSPRPA